MKLLTYNIQEGGENRPSLIAQVIHSQHPDLVALHASSPGYTYPAHHPWLRLDYIFASPSMAEHLVSCEVIENHVTGVASDHLPVRAEFHLEPGSVA